MTKKFYLHCESCKRDEWMTVTPSGTRCPVCGFATSSDKVIYELMKELQEVQAKCSNV